MEKEAITKLHTEFEQIVQIEDETGIEFWLARDLQLFLGYAKWDNFAKVIGKAKFPVKQQVTNHPIIFLISGK